MRLWRWCSLIVAILLMGINIIAAPILQNTEPHNLPVHKTIYVDRNLSEDELVIIISAAWEWHAATDGLVNYTVIRLPTGNFDPKDALVIVAVSPDFPDVVALDNIDPSGIHLGYYNNKSLIPYIALVPSNIEDSNYKTVVLHELGHSLGLSHNEGWRGVGTLMYHEISLGANFITDDDLHNFCKLYQCDATHLHDQ